MSRKTANLTGILVACVTPFTADGSEVDVANLHSQVDRMIAAGIHGLVPTGTTGEFTTLTSAEYEQVISEFVKASNGRVPVVPGIGSTSTARVIELAQHAERAGADAIMLLPPFYDAPAFPALKVFMTSVAESISIPIMYYNVPGATGVHLTADQLAELGDIPGVDYMKDTSGDAVSLTNLIVSKGDRISAFNGWDTLTFVGMSLGAKASVWGMAGFIPELAAQLWNTLAVKKDLTAGRELWGKLWPIADFVESVNYVAAVKAAHELIGSPAGPTRAPVLPLSASERETLRQLLQAAGVKTV